MPREGYRSILSPDGKAAGYRKNIYSYPPGARRTEAPMSRQGIWTGFSPHCAAACSWEGKRLASLLQAALRVYPAGGLVWDSWIV